MSGGRYEFSLIIPTYARPGQLGSCLASLTHLEYAVERFEVIVVDDGSPEPLDRVVKPFRGRLNLTLLRKPNGGPGSARNAGAAVARGRFLAFTDDDCWPAPDWLRRLEARFAQTPERLIGGRTVNRLTGNPYAATSQLIVDLVYAFYNQDRADARFFASNNFALPADLFHRIGGFDDGFFKAAAEDRELCDRWRHWGYALTYAPEAIVLHAHPLTFRSFCKQHFTYGRGALRYHQIRARRGSGRLRSDLPFHAWLPAVVCARLAQLPLGRAATVATLLLLWQVANAAGFFYEAYRAWKAKGNAPGGSGRTALPDAVPGSVEAGQQPAAGPAC